MHHFMLEPTLTLGRKVDPARGKAHALPQDLSDSDRQRMMFS